MLIGGEILFDKDEISEGYKLQDLRKARYSEEQKDIRGREAPLRRTISSSVQRHKMMGELKNSRVCSNQTLKVI